MAGQIRIVSPERITAELQRILTEPHRSRGVRLLLEIGLAAEIVPEMVFQDPSSREHALAVLDQLPQATFPRSLAVLFHGRVGAGRGPGDRQAMADVEPRYRSGRLAAGTLRRVGRGAVETLVGRCRGSSLRKGSRTCWRSGRPRAGPGAAMRRKSPGAGGSLPGRRPSWTRRRWRRATTWSAMASVPARHTVGCWSGSATRNSTARSAIASRRWPWPTIT